MAVFQGFRGFPPVLRPEPDGDVEDRFPGGQVRLPQLRHLVRLHLEPKVLGGLQFAGHTAAVAVRPAAAPAAAQQDAPDVPQLAFRGTLLTSLFIPEALVPGAPRPSEMGQG